MADATPTREEGIVGVFSRAAGTYDRIGPRFFAHFGQRLVEQRLERLEAPVLAQLKDDMLHKVQVLKQADGIHTLFRALCAVGTKPVL